MKKYDLKKFTLEEKCSLLTGSNTWQTNDANGKAKAVWVSDGPSGLRMHNPKNTDETFTATALPTCHVLANTWNLNLAYEYGATIADECIYRGADVLLAPGVNIKRTPLCGRNFEYFSEDPYLSGKFAVEYVKGLQDKGIGTSVKHYCANNSEYDRCHQSSEVDERALHEVYLKPFEMAMEAKPWTVMCSYNPVNGVYASENKKLLDTVLRGQFGFDGLIMSDWGAVHNPVRAVEATLDLCMPHYEGYAEKLVAAVKSGRLTEKQIDERAEKVLELVEKSEKAAAKRKVESTEEERHARAVKMAEEGMVLLKNEGGILPLKGVCGDCGKKEKIFVYGSISETPYISGGGSGRVQTAFKQTALHTLIAEKTGAEVDYRGDWQFGQDWRDMFLRAYDADVTILPVGHGYETEYEGDDRSSIRLSEKQEDKILKIAAHSHKTVVLVFAGSAVDMSRWIDAVDAVVFVGFAGEGVNEALSALLCGEANFSGKLTETFPMTLEDTYKGGDTKDGETDLYDDGIFVGYRYYDHANKEVLFPFGHGLSYAKFEYTNLKIEKKGDTDYELSYDITNVSDVAGKEVSQVYVKDVSAMVHRPEKELKAFSKDEILPHETKTVRVVLDYSSFAYYSTALEKWYVENGWFEIYVGGSSRELPLKGKLNIERPEDTQYSTK